MTGPIMDSRTREHLLCAYADGELDAQQTVDVERMIAEDPELGRVVDAHREVSALLRTACAESHYATAPLALPVVRRRRWSMQPPAWAMAAGVALVIGFGGGLYWNDRSADAQGGWLSEVAEYHDVFSRETRHLVEIPASDVKELTTWLSDRVGRELVVPDFSPNGLRFVGGRMLVVDGKPVAELMYTRPDGRPIAFCMLEAERHGSTTPVRLDQRKDLTLASWRSGGHDFVIVGQMTETLARDLADRARRQIAG